MSVIQVVALLLAVSIVIGSVLFLVAAAWMLAGWKPRRTIVEFAKYVWNNHDHQR